MIEQGLVLLIQSGLGSPPMAPGGFAAQLPKDQISASAPMAWTYESIDSLPEYLLSGQSDWTEWRVRINCHGNVMADAINLARAIDRTLRGLSVGPLPDPDHTFVHGLYRESSFIDGFSDANRSFVRSFEYVIQYSQI